MSSTERVENEDGSMANYSSETRKEQVFNYLRTRINGWVDGTALANEQVGGSEGLKRLRELRKDLKESRYDIEMRGHPDPNLDIFQYRLVERSPEGSQYNAEAPAEPMQVANDPPERTPTPVVKRPGPSEPRQAFKNARGHLVYDDDTKQYLAVIEGEPEPIVQPNMGVATDDGLKYKEMPTRLDFGNSRPCPKCHGLHRKKKGSDGRVLNPPQYEMETRNPNKTTEICPRCNGFGLVPV